MTRPSKRRAKKPGSFRIDSNDSYCIYDGEHPKEVKHMINRYHHGFKPGYGYLYYRDAKRLHAWLTRYIAWAEEQKREKKK